MVNESFIVNPLNLKSKSLSLVKKPNSVNILISLSFLSPPKLSAEEKIVHRDKFVNVVVKIFLSLFIQLSAYRKFLHRE